MEKRITLLIALMLISVFALAACGSPKPTEETNTVNLPVVDIGGEVTEAPEVVEVPAQPTAVEDPYPVTEDGVPVPLDVLLAYPIDMTSPDFDQQMESYLQQLFGDKHSLESLLEKDLSVEQWRAVLTDSDHVHLNLSEGAIQAIIDWFTQK